MLSRDTFVLVWMSVYVMFEPGPPVCVPERNNFLESSLHDSGYVLFRVIDVLLTTEAMARS